MSSGIAYLTGPTYHLLAKSDNTGISTGETSLSRATDSPAKVIGTFEILIVPTSGVYKIRQFATSLNATNGFW